MILPLSFHLISLTALALFLLLVALLIWGGPRGKP